MGRLLTTIAIKDFSSPKAIHPHLHQAYQQILQEQKALRDGVGKLCRLGAQERMLQHGEITCLWVSFELTRGQPGLFVVLKADSQGEDTGVKLILEVILTKALQRSHGKVCASVQNNTSLPVRLKGQVIAATPIDPSGLLAGAPGEIPEDKLQDSSLPPE